MPDRYRTLLERVANELEFILLSQGTNLPLHIREPFRAVVLGIHDALGQKQAEPFSPDNIARTQAAWTMGYEARKAEERAEPSLRTGAGQMTHEQERLERAEMLLRRCLDGFGAYIHGRKLKRQQRDRLREDLEQFLEGRRVRTLQPERDVSVADGRDWS